MTCRSHPHFSTLLLFYSLIPVSLGHITCEATKTGTYTFFNGLGIVHNTPFSCVQRSSENRIVHAPALNTSSQFCDVSVDEHVPTKTIYEKDDKGSLTCVYKCEQQTDEYSCTSDPFAGQCACESGHVTATVTLLSPSQVGGEQIDLQAEQQGTYHLDTCDGKYEGYKFREMIPCMNIRAQVDHVQVHFLPGSSTRCRAESGAREETRYERVPTEERGLQQCRHVCRVGSPVCTGQTEGGECNCRSTGLVKHLVPSDTSLQGVVREYSRECGNDSECGPCGECVKTQVEGVEQHKCRLVADAYLGDFCPCGEVCPQVDLRRDEEDIFTCQPRLDLACMTYPKWEADKEGSEYVPGSIYPDNCISGQRDVDDGCGCHEQYELYFSEEDKEKRCRQREP